MTRAAAQVRLKPVNPFAPHGGVKLARHSGEGGAFVVALCDATGASDFRAETLHAGYDQALKWAQETSRSQAVPIVDETGAAEVKAAAPAKPVKTERGAVPTAAAAGLASKPAAELTRQLAAMRTDRGATKALDPYISAAGPVCTDAEAEIVFERAHVEMTERRATIRGAFEGDDQRRAYTQHTHDTHLVMMTRLKIDSDLDRLKMLAVCEGLAARISELESRDPAKIYGGALKEGDVAQAGQFYTHGGSLWYCHTTTDGRPATEPQSFTLSVKRGQADKAAR